MAYALILVSAALTISTVPALRLHKRPGDSRDQKDPSACKCLNWRTVYGSGLIECGMGNEYYFNTSKLSPKKEDISIVKKEQNQSVCHYFFERLDFNKCMNINVGKYEGQWCYVSQDCHTLNGGAKLNGINWKLCREAKPDNDELTRDVGPVMLNSYAWDFDINFGILHKFAYPCEKGHQGQIWPHMAKCWGLNNESDYKTLPNWLSRKCNEIMAAGKPWSFDTREDQNLPHVIVVGFQVFRVDVSPWKNWDHPGTYETLTVVQ